MGSSFILHSLLIFLISQTVTSNPACQPTIPGMTNVHLVCHTHDDVGWLKTIDQYYYGSNKDITWVGVQYILDSIIPSLLKDPSRKFIYVESAFFFRWWDEQTDEMKNVVKSLVESGQLEFISGGWSMNDEGATHYNAIIDQMTLGLSKLNETFGSAAFPRIAWQIDPFGHSKEQASLFAQMGMDGLFFGRLDHDDKNNRWNTKQMEMVWRASNNLGDAKTSLFTGVLPNGYSPPSGFCFDLLCNDDPIMDNPNLEDYNKDDKVDRFLQAVADQQNGYATSNLIMTMGDDFNYVYADSWFKNLNKLISYVNARQSNGSNVNVFYSTPSCYLDALYAEDLEWPTKTDDFFPYSSDPHAYWTGYFTSRPTFKGFMRHSNNFLQAAKQVAALTGLQQGPSIETLARAMGAAQHHDAATGTAKQHVSDDYSKRLAEGVAATTGVFEQGLGALIDPTNPSPKLDGFTYCPLLNISSCPPIESETTFVVNVYNPVSRPVSQYIRIPVASELNYEVTDGAGNPLVIQIVPIPASIINLPGRESSANYELIFFAEDLPALSTEQFQVSVGVKSGHGQSNFRSHKVGNSIKDVTVEKGNFRLTLDGISHKLKSIGVFAEKGLSEMNVTQNWMWYAAMAGDNHNDESRPSGAYIFRPDGEASDLIGLVNATEVFEGPLLTEIHQEWTSWVTQVIRLFNNKSYIEVEWLVGPIPVDDGIGKEIVHRLQWEGLITENTFYTDANGREMQKRVKDFRETWNLVTTEPISQNYYPVTSKLILSSTDGGGQAAILNDRAQGGTSLSEGQMELMVHRRLLYDDAKGVGEALNEQAFKEGLVARGRHLLLHSDFDSTDCDFGCQHRTIAEELLLQPIITFSSPASFSLKSNAILKKSGLNSALPANIRILTLEPWYEGKWLLRLENYYEQSESSNSGTSSVDIQNLFADWAVTDIEELTLGANLRKVDLNRLQWKTLPDTRSSPPSHENREDPLPEYLLSPMEIRTFTLTVIGKPFV